MKIILILIIGLSLISFVQTDKNRKTDYLKDIQAYQQEMNKEFLNEESSPLTKEDLAHFSQLNFYPINQNYCVKAKLKLNSQPKEFGMKTTTARLPIYIKYGVAYFKLNGKKHQINIYQNVELASREGFRDYLFMLFTDLSSGVESYAGGRYIDLRIPINNAQLIIDFNKAYNPYCAYNSKYSCPIPSVEDHIDTEILVGVKKYH